MNLATQLIRENGEDLDDYFGECSQVTEMVLERYDGEMVWVYGDAVAQYDWWYHAVPLIDGKIHDAWLEGWHGISEPLTLANWLVKMFGTEEELEVTIGGEAIYRGLPQNYAAVL